MIFFFVIRFYETTNKHQTTGIVSNFWSAVCIIFKIEKQTSFEISRFAHIKNSLFIIRTIYLPIESQNSRYAFVKRTKYKFELVSLDWHFKLSPITWRILWYVDNSANVRTYQPVQCIIQFMRCGKLKHTTNDIESYLNFTYFVWCTTATTPTISKYLEEKIVNKSNYTLLSMQTANIKLHEQLNIIQNM